MKSRGCVNVCIGIGLMIFLIADVRECDASDEKSVYYDQVVSRFYPEPEGEAQCIGVISRGGEERVYIGADNGLNLIENGEIHAVKELSGEAIEALADAGEVLYVLSGGRVYAVKGDEVEAAAEVGQQDVVELFVLDGKLGFVTRDGVYIYENEEFKADEDFGDLSEGEIYAAVVSSTGALALGTSSGLLERSVAGEWEQLYPHDEKGRSWAPREVRGVGYDEEGRLWFASPQGVGVRDGERWRLFTGSEGLPYNDFTCLASGRGGEVWFGTRKGVILYEGEDFRYYQGRRWLPDDEVQRIAVDEQGDAWVLGAGGVGEIARVAMTLREKAEYYEDEMKKYIKRTEYGYVSEVHLPVPGDRSRVIYSDSDNDGLWTAMYGAGECFAYGATKDLEAKRRAREAYEALRFLHDVTIGAEVELQTGYVARTVVPTTEPNPNERSSYTLEGMKRTRDRGDRLWKVYYPRFPLSRDGKYWFKTDTSSDELDGHYFFYPRYYDLVAETEEEREAVREVVRSITDHLMRNDFKLIDHDGTPTRWGIYDPNLLNRTLTWHVERGLNSLSMLSYLSVAWHVTGDEKYRDAIEELCEKHSYDINAMAAKMQNGIGSGNQSDDEMAVMCYYNIIQYAPSEELREMMRLSFYYYWVREFPEMNPFFNFAYAACAMGASYSDPWDTISLSPWEGWLEDSVETLQRFPLDRVNWGHENSHRLDIVHLERQAARDSNYPAEQNRGYRVTGKVLPVENRHFNHWNTDPWALDYRGDGRTLASGTVYLLPYYMGLYHGYIE